MKVIFSSSRVRGIPYGTFSPLVELRELDLSDNEIEKIGMPTTLSEKFHTNSTVYLPTASLSKWRSLDLSENRIKQISVDSLRGMKYLVFLDLSHNNLTRIGNEFAFLMGVKTLDLSHNSIWYLGTRFAHYMVLLDFLNLSRNSITEIPSLALFHCIKLTRLDLSFNLLTSISSAGVSNVECGKSLAHLLLQQNKIFVVRPDDLSVLTLLETLDLSYNAIEQIEGGAFSFCSKLKELRLNNNKLRMINSSSFLGLSKIEVLNLADNEIVKIDENAFSRCVFLKYLYLQNNALTFLYPTLFQDLPLLRIVDVSHNYLTVLHKEWFITSTGRFYVQNDTGQVLPVYNISSASINTEGNLWRCDCKIRRFYYWVARQTKFVQLRFRNIRCSSPHSKKLVLQLTSSELLNCDSFSVSALLSLYRLQCVVIFLSVFVLGSKIMGRIFSK